MELFRLGVLILANMFQDIMTYYSYESNTTIQRIRWIKRASWIFLRLEWRRQVRQYDLCLWDAWGCDCVIRWKLQGHIYWSEKFCAKRHNSWKMKGWKCVISFHTDQAPIRSNLHIFCLMSSHLLEYDWACDIIVPQVAL